MKLGNSAIDILACAAVAPQAQASGRIPISMLLNADPAPDIAAPALSLTPATTLRPLPVEINSPCCDAPQLESRGVWHVAAQPPSKRRRSEEELLVANPSATNSTDQADSAAPAAALRELWRTVPAQSAAPAAAATAWLPGQRAPTPTPSSPASESGGSSPGSASRSDAEWSPGAGSLEAEPDSSDRSSFSRSRPTSKLRRHRAAALSADADFRGSPRLRGPQQRRRSRAPRGAGAGAAPGGASVARSLFPRARKHLLLSDKPRLFAHPAVVAFADVLYGAGEGQRGQRLLLLEGHLCRVLFGISHNRYAIAHLGGETRKTSLEHVGTRIRKKRLEQPFGALVAELRTWTASAAAQQFVGVPTPPDLAGAGNSAPEEQ
eukprot:TRINITY_DN10662_c0_g1_i1.p1 TRINITY_DN10662_c0_g1~~TRINITY_DN10662_c0_g1_i1.p1  ORF type:complete len:378 (+),score=62.11 TRINITY_DN10662_c0_g1_i1:54-1187(+)